MEKKTIDVSLQNEKLNNILHKKQDLEATIEDYEKRIDEKISSLVADGFIPEKGHVSENIIELEESAPVVQPIIEQEQEDVFANIDLTDDAALDQAVLKSKPVSYLPESSQEPSFNESLIFSVSDDEDLNPEILPENEHAEVNFALEEPTTEVTAAPAEQASVTLTEAESSNEQSEKLLEPEQEQTENSEIFETEKPKQNRKVKEKRTDSNPLLQPKIQDILLPAVLFILGIVACSVYFIGFSSNFSFIDYSILFILLTCLIFTIALPYSASIFFMVFITVGYGLFIIFSTLYIKIPLAAYQFGWFLLIPLTLTGSALLVKRIREVFLFKKELENQISSYDSMESSPGLTAEKAYYKDLKQAMERASKNETVLVLELLAIPHLSTLRSINGSRLWDEILFKTLKIIKRHCYSSHLIYILEGNVFSIIMENTSGKNQALINQEIQNEFKQLLVSYDSIDDDSGVELKIISVPYSREISNPFDYRALLFKHLEQ
ncbi:diguanylate cyclase [Eubacteriaceae bacterium ES3]|nr:diguanylate cyclase [Eubacteriaceae bacterium ES3]